MSDTLSGSIPQLAAGTPVLPPAVLAQAVNPARTARDREAGARLPSLDGWRAISILMVLGAHCEFVGHQPIFSWFDGSLGVLFFFVISGFLITWLMLAENDRTGRISLRHFYIRRALRILPVFYTFLIVVAALQCFTPYSQNWGKWVQNLTFTTNFGPDPSSPFTTSHLWSLSVEEQFYLLWPLTLVLLLKRGAGTRQLLGFLALSLLAVPVFKAMGHHKFPAFLAPVLGDRSFFCNFNVLAVGCACAVYLRKVWRTDAAQNIFRTQRVPVLFLGLVLVAVPYVFEKFRHTSTPLRIFQFTMLPTCEASGFALLMLQSVFLPGWGIYRALNWRWVCQIGVLSYSIYIWQQIFCSGPETFGWAPVWWMSFPGWLIPVLIVSAASYYGLERPILKWRGRFLEPAIGR